MTGTIRGPAILIAQFAGDEVPFNSGPAICRWAAQRAPDRRNVTRFDAALGQQKALRQSR